MAKKELTKRKIQAINTKEKLFQTALALFKKKGYDNVTIEDICKKASVSVGVFYYYFKTKSDIFVEVFSQADNEFYRYITENLTSLDSITKIITFFSFYAKNTQSIGSDIIKIVYNPDNCLFNEKGRSDTFLQDLIANAQKNNELTLESNSEEITRFLFVAARGVVYDWCVHNGSFDLENAMRNYMTRLLTLFKK